jgi:hypothetical protein
VMAGPTIPTNSTKLARTIGRLGKPVLERGQGMRLGVLANKAAVNPASFLAVSRLRPRRSRALSDRRIATRVLGFTSGFRLD